MIEPKTFIGKFDLDLTKYEINKEVQNQLATLQPKQKKTIENAKNNSMKTLSNYFREVPPNVK